MSWHARLARDGTRRRTPMIPFFIFIQATSTHAPFFSSARKLFHPAILAAASQASPLSRPSSSYDSRTRLVISRDASCVPLFLSTCHQRILAAHRCLSLPVPPPRWGVQYFIWTCVLFHMDLRIWCPGVRREERRPTGSLARRDRRYPSPSVRRADVSEFPLVVVARQSLAP